MALTKRQEKDYKKWFKYEGDPGFSPERNNQVIEDSIKAYEAYSKLLSNKFTDELKERVHAAASYLLHLGRGKTTKLENYFSRQYLAYLQGQRIVQKAKRLKDGRRIITLEEIA